MKRSMILAGLMVIQCTGGCMNPPLQTPQVPANPFGYEPHAKMPQKSYQAAPSLQTAARVDAMAQKLLAANPQLGMKPVIRTVGAPQPEIFHVGTTELVITEGLANQCKTDAQLAAVLSMELGRMIAQRERLAGPTSRQQERFTPLDSRIGLDNGGTFGPADQLYRAELAKQETNRRNQIKAAAVPLDPDGLARSYLMQAGFAPHDLDSALPLLKQAAENTKLAAQMTATPP